MTGMADLAHVLSLYAKAEANQHPDEEEVCDLCFTPIGCGCGCDEWEEYWDSLSPEERQEELRMMDEYARESYE